MRSHRSGLVSLPVRDTPRPFPFPKFMSIDINQACNQGVPHTHGCPSQTSPPCCEVLRACPCPLHRPGLHPCPHPGSCPPPLSLSLSLSLTPPLPQATYARQSRTIGGRGRRHQQWSRPTACIPRTAVCLSLPAGAAYIVTGQTKSATASGQRLRTCTAGWTACWQRLAGPSART